MDIEKRVEKIVTKTAKEIIEKEGEEKLLGYNHAAEEEFDPLTPENRARLDGIKDRLSLSRFLVE